MGIGSCVCKLVQCIKVFWLSPDLKYQVHTLRHVRVHYIFALTTSQGSEKHPIAPSRDGTRVIILKARGNLQMKQGQSLSFPFSTIYPVTRLYLSTSACSRPACRPSPSTTETPPSPTLRAGSRLAQPKSSTQLPPGQSVPERRRPFCSEVRPHPLSSPGSETSHRQQC